MSMPDVFSFRNDLVREYREYSRSFSFIRTEDLRNKVEDAYGSEENGRFWPEPLIQINPHYRKGRTVQELVAEGTLHPLCARIFQVGKGEEGGARPLRLFQHQMEALALASRNLSYVVTTGTGSGKSLAFFLPMVDRILRAKEVGGKARTRALVIYPMNALANSQMEEIRKFLSDFDPSSRPFQVERYTGQESEEDRRRIVSQPPDILLTNFMMLEMMLTRQNPEDRGVLEHCRGLEFLVLDELHSYRGRQGADVALLVRRLRQRLNAPEMLCIGTSATMSNGGSEEDQKTVVARVASCLFGRTVEESSVVGETLERVTREDRSLEDVCPLLASRIARGGWTWESFDAFREDPLAIWVELNLGIELPDAGTPRRACPLGLTEAGARLARDAQVTEVEAREALQGFLQGAYRVTSAEGASPFAFKLHQFISGPGKVFATLEAPGVRSVTLDEQLYAPGRQEEGVRLYSCHFCRECGQEVHPVERDGKTGHFLPRDIEDRTFEDEDGCAAYGFLVPQGREGETAYRYTGSPEDLPEGWLDPVKGKVKSHFKKYVPHPVLVSPTGQEGRGEAYWYLPGSFRFCPRCGAEISSKSRDVTTLPSLSGEGRSSATTLLTFTALRLLYQKASPDAALPDPRKILGFSDNRQDAALQAGHFNDFLFLLNLRSGLLAALENNGGVLPMENLASEVFRAFGFHLDRPEVLGEFLKDPELEGQFRDKAREALRFVLGYRLVRDLRRGWRFNNPNLDQLGLVHLDYPGLSDYCRREDLWGRHEKLRSFSPEVREGFARLLFRHLLHHLCVETPYLQSEAQEKIRLGSGARLVEGWSFPQEEQLFLSNTLGVDMPGGRGGGKKHPEATESVKFGARSTLVRLLKRGAFWEKATTDHRRWEWSGQEWEETIQGFLEVLSPQYLSRTEKGWRLQGEVLEWRAGPDPQSGPGRPNRFFRDLYALLARELREGQTWLYEFESQEHTAQVDSETRQILEKRFRYEDRDRKELQELSSEKRRSRLPVLFCSPTMELGVDISSLNVVYLRNTPPTPANYAQRSGRAGRSGQPALVLSYCAARSPHDQWFFRYQGEMVHGVVKPPTLDLANRDLLESHFQAIWLGELRGELPGGIEELLNLEEPGKPLKDPWRTQLQDPEMSRRASEAARQVLHQVLPYVDPPVPWLDEAYVEGVISRAFAALDGALNRWRGLLEATRRQKDLAHEVMQDYSSSKEAREEASRRYQDAHRQDEILRQSGSRLFSDFYLYRYLASQGFLPGYNFPRLPLMAWIPATGSRSGGRKDGGMVTRPRFLAISEFGPRSLIYHQGRTFRVVRAKLNLSDVDQASASGTLPTRCVRICPRCGYGHMGSEVSPEPREDLCLSCGCRLDDQGRINHLFRVETVETRPAERISVNDEDRRRQGFEIQTTYQFAEGLDGTLARTEARILGEEGEELGTLVYAPAAQVWRINKGLRRRKNPSEHGFFINPRTGWWSKNPEEEENREEEEKDKAPTQILVPYVEDRRNVLLLTPAIAGDETVMATLEAALQRGIEQVFQVEESEVLVEPLPDGEHRRVLLFYEATEGGAGVLSRLAREEGVLAEVARRGLERMHYNPATLEEIPEDRQDCQAGCYRCLLSYYNQPDHRHIDRRNPLVLKLLSALTRSRVRGEAAEGEGESGASWKKELAQRGLRLPDETDFSVAEGRFVVPGLYRSARVFLTLGVPPEGLEDYAEERGYRVLHLPEAPSLWGDFFAQNPDLFGKAGLLS